MKKTIILTGIIIACICSASATVSAKDGREKKDVSEYLPEAGDFAFSVSANPFIDFIGNIFNNTANQHIGNFGGDPYNNGYFQQPAVSVSGKYMFTDELGLRVNLGWIHDGNTDNYGIKHPVFPIPPYRSRNLLFFRFPHHFPSEYHHESILPFHQDSSWYSCIPKI